MKKILLTITTLFFTLPANSTLIKSEKEDVILENINKEIEFFENLYSCKKDILELGLIHEIIKRDPKTGNCWMTVKKRNGVQNPLRVIGACKLPEKVYKKLSKVSVEDLRSKKEKYINNKRVLFRKNDYYNEVLNKYCKK